MDETFLSSETDVYQHLVLESDGSRILVVDSEMHLRVLTTEVLTWFGYQVDSVEDGLAAWEILQVKRYDLLIANHNLSRTTKGELIGKISEFCLTLPVILTSGKISADELKRSLLLPSKAAIGTPYSAVELLDTVKRVLSDLSPAAVRQSGFR